MGASSNALWCADYKGEFRLGNLHYCYPLTVTDHASRYLLLCEAMESNQERFAITAFERLFKERGLPAAIRSDNGDVKLMALIGAFLGTKLTVLTIFAASLTGSLFGLSTVLAVWIKRIRRVQRRGTPSTEARRRAWHSARLALRYYEMPFGVFLGGMALLAFLFGNQVLHWYWRAL